MDNYFEKKKKKLPKLMNRILKEIKKGQDERKIIPGGPYEIFSLHTSLLLGIAVLNMKHQDNQFVPHAELLKLNGFYAELYNSQFSGSNPMEKTSEKEDS